ncbi:MAG: hypothetical protein HOP13_04925 [Alphaproteobacteria bacterium]|nr:hypothetical protein [Alphaproteobacteria bacterium]
MIAIAPLDQALTFARSREGSDARLIAVRACAEGRVKGIDITGLATWGDDPISVFNRLGYERIKVEVESSIAAVDVPEADLTLPVDLTGAHIAVGTNYREHAKESSVVGGPFLFPKMVTPTSWCAAIPASDALLDYEVELCLVPLKPIGPNDAATGGLILGNDVTDRATLLRNVDPSNPQSGKGFTSGKSATGYLPVGNMFVVPRDLKSFVAGLTLQLSVNGMERQRAPVTEWIWDLDEILRRSRARRDTSWTYWGGMARLPFTPEGAIPPRTLIMAGTPAGTIWQGLRRKDYALGAVDCLLSAFTKPIAKCVVERYIAGARRAKTYLQSGDEISIRVDHLGSLANLVTLVPHAQHLGHRSG